jgi:hypothetical protein
MPLLGTALLWAIVTELLKPASRTSTGAATSALVDMRGFKGPVAVVLHSAKAAAGTTPTLTPKLVHSDASNGTPADLEDLVWVDSDGAEVAEITDAADPGPLVCIFDPRETDGFVGFVGTIAGTNTPTFVCGVSYAAVPAGPVPAEAAPADPDA